MPDFKEQIRNLVELQKLDTDLYRLKKELALQPEERKAHEAEFAKKKTSLAAAESEQKALQLKQKEKELELGTKEEKIKKLQAQLYQLKSNKEYSAMELEIKGLKADNSVLEEEILRILDEVEAARAKCLREKELLAVEEKKFKEAVDAITRREEGLRGEIAAYEEKRKAFTPHVDAKMLAQYERVLAKRDGLAIAPLYHGSCGGCHMELPPQVANEIQMQDKLIVCESCARILYWLP